MSLLRWADAPMEHDPLFASTSASRADPDRGSLDASAEVADCLRGRAALAQSRQLLVVSIEAVDGRAATPPDGACAVYRLPETAPASTGSSHDPWLPFDDAAFDAVVLYRVTSHNVAIELLLGEAGRVLRPEGRVLVLEHETDFAFAPLPEAGPAHLLHVWLRQAGFAHVDISERAGSRVVAVAHA